MASLVADGAVPYQDFFVSQPPLQVYFLSLMFSLFGFSIVALKMVPLLATIGSGVLLYLTAREKFGWQSGIVSVAFFLFSFEVLSKSTFNFGVNLALFFVALGFYLLYVRKQMLFAGLVFGIAGMVRFYAIIPALVIGVLLLVKKRDAFVRFCLGFAGTFVLPNIVLLLVFGSSYYTPVIAYHFLKVAEGTSTFSVFMNILSENWMVLLPLVLLPLLKRRKNFQLPLFIVLAYVVFLVLSKRVFEYYFIPLFYFVSLLTGSIVMQLLRNKNMFRYACVVFLVVAGWFTLGNVIFVENIILGEFAAAQEMATYIDEHSAVGTLLFGDVSTAPLLGLMTGRSLVGNIVDTNGMTFTAGVVDVDVVLDALSAEQDVIVVARPGQSIGNQRRVVDYLETACSVMTFYEDRVEGQFVLYRCTQEII
jgi:4-amino-4-deoxy-L-arabinose transferase-like glycosyltransferase